MSSPADKGTLVIEDEKGPTSNCLDSWFESDSVIVVCASLSIVLLSAEAIPLDLSLKIEVVRVDRKDFEEPKVESPLLLKRLSIFPLLLLQLPPLSSLESNK